MTVRHLKRQAHLFHDISFRPMYQWTRFVCEMMSIIALHKLSIFFTYHPFRRFGTLPSSLAIEEYSHQRDIYLIFHDWVRFPLNPLFECCELFRSWNGEQMVDMFILRNECYENVGGDDYTDNCSSVKISRLKTNFIFV